MDLETCDREPIHIPGAIQPHGVLLALDGESFAVRQVAGDTEGLIGLPRDQLLGAAPEGWLGEGAGARLRELGSAAWSPGRPLHAFAATLPHSGRLVEAALHRSNGALVAELEPSAGDDAEAAMAWVQGMVQRLHGAADLAAFYQTAVDGVRAFTGFDRVMVYRFLPDGSGSVEAEARAPDVESFMGQHYPASDIPRQARALYQRNWIRLIPDAGYTPARLFPQNDPVTGRPLDLTQSVLRSVSPVHVEYLANMGVRAAMSLSLVLQGELWGLIACHHRAPRPVSRRRRNACELFAEMASFQLEARVIADGLAAQLHAKRVQEELLARLGRETDFAEGLISTRPNLLDLIPAGGVALWFDGAFSPFGRTPRPDQVTEIVEWLDGRGERVFATDRLAELFPRARGCADVASGLLALSVSRTTRDYVLWFRPEVVKTITWAGNPQKAVEVTDEGARISPRRSFAAWREAVRMCAQPWRPDEIEAARSLRLALLEVVLARIDQLAREREAARRRQELLMAELDHRVKNLLATIQALLAQTRGAATTLDAFVEGFEGRLRAMSRSHSLLTQSRWEGASLAALIAEEMAPYIGGGEPAVVIGGAPPVLLRPKAALALSLAVHELATNAAKYGALSVAGGRVRIAWRADRAGGDALLLRWQEEGGPPVQPPTRRGFGLTLIEKSLAYELGGEVRLDFPPAGMVCTVVVPWDQIASPPEEPAPPSGAAAPRGADELAGLRLLVVEDNALVASALVESLQAAGAQVLGPAARVAAAVELAETAAIDCALLDVDLDGTPVWPAAAALERRGIPFVLATGHQAGLVAPARFRDRPVVNKPFTLRELAAAIGRTLRRHGGGGGGGGAAAP